MGVRFREGCEDFVAKRLIVDPPGEEQVPEAVGGCQKAQECAKKRNVHVRQASGRPGLGEGTKDQREIERGGLQQDSLGDVATAAHMDSSQTAGLLLMRERPLQKFAAPPE